MSGRLGDASSTSIRRRPTAGLSPNPLRSPYSLSPYLTHEEDGDLAVSETYGRDSPKCPRPFMILQILVLPMAFQLPVEDKNKPYKEKEPVSHPSTVSHSRSHEVETSSSPFHTVPLTPEMESRSCSVQGHVSTIKKHNNFHAAKTSYPDFGLLREPLRQALVAPLNFFRSRSARQSQQSTNSQQTSSTSRTHHFRLSRLISLQKHGKRLASQRNLPSNCRRLHLCLLIPCFGVPLQVPLTASRKS
jgi:hypothetical protein